MFIGIFYCLKQSLSLIFKVHDQGYQFGYCLILIYIYEFQYYVLSKMSPGYV
jgi:hypothetical protein